MKSSDKDHSRARIVRPRATPTEQVLVFAYGSNLQSSQMRERCPSARLVGTAHVRCARLAFAGYSPRWGGAVATLRPADKGVNAPGVVWAISPDDLLRLDGFEGAPHSYFRGTTKCRMNDGETLEAVAYALPMARAEMSPSASYARAVLRGYREHELPMDGLIEAFLSNGVLPPFIQKTNNPVFPVGRATH